MDKVNTSQLQEQAAQLLEKKKQLEEQCAACGQLIQQLGQHCNDAAYVTFAARYKEYQPTMDNICSWLQSYRDFLVGVGDSYDEFIRRAMERL